MGRSPKIDGDNISFGGSDPNFEQEGNYTSVGGVLNAVINRNTLIPNGNGNFSYFFGDSLDGNNIAFWGLDSNFEQSGIYTSINGVINVVADTNTSIPNGTGNFDPFSFGDFSLEGDTVTFLGTGGIHSSTGGLLETVIASNTLLPDGNTKLCGFDPYISVDGDNIAFGSTVCDAITDQYLTGGIYAYLDQELVKVIEFEDSLDGKEIADALFAGSNTLDENSIAFWVRFTDGSEAIYLAQAEAVTESVPEPSSILGLSALGFLGAGTILKRIKQKQKV